MNWIDIGHRLETIGDFKYSGPFNKYYKNKDYWSNYAYHTLKIKCPVNYSLDRLRSPNLTTTIYKINSDYYKAEFEIIYIRILSKTCKETIVKLEVSKLELTTLEKDHIRDLQLSELFEL